ncbi:MAG: CvpA family protein [Phycisphaeraceae bacterium]|nr:CvpA family protein [Phycisphaeraceae bacterium]
MFMSLLAIAVIGLLGYIWMTRGFFSALIHMVCVIIAGAIAFALWEPLSYLILAKGPDDRKFTAFVLGTAWAWGLVVPFAASLALLRLGVDKLIPANVQVQSTVSYVGGAACGAVSGVITAGIVVIALGTMRMSSDFLGYQPIQYQGESLRRTGGLIVPVDRLVGSFYGHLSETAFRTSQPLARWYPDVSHTPAVMRLTDRQGRAKNFARPAEFEVIRRYRVGGEGVSVVDLLRDSWGVRPHDAKQLDGTPYPPGSRIEGIVLDFKPSIKELHGQIVLGEGQIWIVVENAQTGDRKTIHPVGVVAKAAPGDIAFGRFRFDSEVFVASAGAAIEPMGFEFVVPPGYEPIAVYVRNIRRELPAGNVATYRSAAERDRDVPAGSILKAGRGGSGPIDRSMATTLGTGRQSDEAARAAGITDTNILVGRFVIQKGREKSLQVGESNGILGGEEKFAPSELQGGAGIDRALQVRTFEVNRGTVMVQVDVSRGRPASLLSPAAAAAGRNDPPYLIDANGTRYPAVGFFYEDQELVFIRYTPGKPVSGIAELQDYRVMLSASRPDQKLTLLFLCDQGVHLSTFAIGDKAVVVLDPPIKLERTQR